MPTDVYSTVAHLLTSGSVRALTSDVFDTIVCRDTAEPVDLNLRLRDALVAAQAIPAHVSGDDFRRARVLAERHARTALRARVGSDECTLQQIWDEMPSQWCMAPRAELVRAELEVQTTALQVIAPAAALLVLAHDAGLPVVLVSDTYFASDMLHTMLQNAGVPMHAVTRVVASCDAGVSKSAGLIGRTIAELAMPAAHVLHIGDHPEADEAAAKAEGAQAVRLSFTRHDLHHPGADAALRRVSHVLGSDGRVSSTVRETLLRSPDGRSPSYQFGAAVAGPLLAGFAGWVADTTAEIGVNTTHCLLREGATIADLMERVRPTSTTRLVHASRWVMTRAAVLTGSVDEIADALGRRSMLTTRNVAGAFNVDPRLVEQVIGFHPVHHAQRPAAVDAIAAHGELRELIVSGASQVRKRLMRYLHDTLDLDASRLVLADIGWGGTIQTCLERVLAAEDIQVPVTGLYLMLSRTGAKRAALGHDLRGYIPFDADAYGHAHTVITLARNAELLERITTPDMGTLLDFTEEGRPITRDIEEHHIPATLALAQRGMRDITDALARESRSALWTHSQPFRLALASGVAASVQAPSAAFAREAGEWPHDDVAGENASTLSSSDAQLPMRYINVNDLAAVDMSEIFWLPGRLAVEQPGLARLLSATANGVDAADLAPPSAAGEAYIAAFPLDSPLATGLAQATPHLNGEGWAFLHLTATVPSLRVIEMSFGDRDCLVQIGSLQCSVDGQQAWVVAGVADLGRRGLLHRGRKVADGVLALRGDGHLVLYPPKRVRVTGGVLRIAVAYRVWPLADGGHHLARVGRLRNLYQTGRRMLARLLP